MIIIRYTNQKYLVKDASIVKSNHFENGFVKIIDGMEADLTMVEKLLWKTEKER